MCQRTQDRIFFAVAGLLLALNFAWWGFVVWWMLQLV
jgi:hypothetical protein